MTSTKDEYLSVPCSECGAHAAFARADAPIAREPLLVCYFCIADRHAVWHLLRRTRHCDPYEQHLAPEDAARFRERQQESNLVLAGVTAIRRAHEENT